MNYFFATLFCACLYFTSSFTMHLDTTKMTSLDKSNYIGYLEDKLKQKDAMFTHLLNKVEKAQKDIKLYEQSNADAVVHTQVTLNELSTQLYYKTVALYCVSAGLVLSILAYIYKPEASKNKDKQKELTPDLSPENSQDEKA
ncbi:hypothetical protein H0X48_00640 [Candidatus Dependentiae bacterium]|nr:hypothetical protein [Candidatus Dependentiae bacterium]